MAADMRLMEEIKLYWTVQFAVAAGLGFGISKLLPDAAISDLAEALKLIGFAWTFSFLSIIGLTYSMRGGYYILKARSDMSVETQQSNKKSSNETIVTPILNIAYIGASGFVWSYVFVQLAYAIPGVELSDKFILMLTGLLFGTFIVHKVGRVVYLELVALDASYSDYTQHLSKLYPAYLEKLKLM